MKRLTRPLSITPPIGPQHELIMALTAQQYTQDACGIGSGPFAALGFAEVTRDLHGLEFRSSYQPPADCIVLPSTRAI
jgi:hypothetical protein